MLELQSDLVRCMALGKASVGVRATGATLGNYESVIEQTYAIKNRPVSKKRRTSWLVMVSVVWLIPLFISVNNTGEHLNDYQVQIHDVGHSDGVMADILQ